MLAIGFHRQAEQHDASEWPEQAEQLRDERIGIAEGAGTGFSCRRGTPGVLPSDGGEVVEVTFGLFENRLQDGGGHQAAQPVDAEHHDGAIETVHRFGRISVGGAVGPLQNAASEGRIFQDQPDHLVASAVVVVEHPHEPGQQHRPAREVFALMDGGGGILIDLGEHLGVLAGDVVVEALHAEGQLEALVEHRHGGFRFERGLIALEFRRGEGFAAGGGSAGRWPGSRFPRAAHAKNEYAEPNGDRDQDDNQSHACRCSSSRVLKPWRHKQFSRRCAGAMIA